MLTKNEIVQAAADVTKDYLDKYGEQYPCGFAWVTVYLKSKGNTTLGKIERQMLADLGFSKSYTSNKEYQFWNPSGNYTQSMDAKYAGAQVAAKMLKDDGYDAVAQCRMD